MRKGLIAIVMATALAVTPGFVTAQMAPGRGTGPTMSGPMGSGAMMQMQGMMQQMAEMMGAPKGKMPEKK